MSSQRQPRAATEVPCFGTPMMASPLEEERRYEKRVGEQLWTVWLRTIGGETELTVAEVGGQVEIAKYPGLADWIERLAAEVHGLRRTWHTAWQVETVEVARKVEQKLLGDGAEVAFWVVRSSEAAALRSYSKVYPRGTVAARFGCELETSSDDPSGSNLFFETVNRGESFEVRLESPPDQALEALFGGPEEGGTYHAVMGQDDLARVLTWVEQRDPETVQDVWGAWELGGP